MHNPTRRRRAGLTKCLTLANALFFLFVVHCWLSVQWLESSGGDVGGTRHPLAAMRALVHRLQQLPADATHERLDVSYAAVESTWLRPLDDGDRPHHPSHHHLLHRPIVTRGGMQDLAYSFHSRRDFATIVEPVDDLLGATHGRDRADSNTAKKQSAREARDVMRLRDAMPREQREILLPDESQHATLSSKFLLFCPETFVSPTPDSDQEGFDAQLRPHVAVLLHRLKHEQRLTGLAQAHFAEVLDVSHCRETDDQPLDDERKPALVHLLRFGGSLRMSHRDSARLLPATLRCLSNFACQGFVLHPAIEEEKDGLTDEDFSLVTSVAWAERGNSSTAVGSRGGVFFALMHRLAGRGALVHHAAAIEVLSGPALHPVCLTQAGDADGGGFLRFGPVMAVRIVNRWFEPIHPSGGLRVQIFEAGSADPTDRDDGVGGGGNGSSSRCRANALLTEVEATVAAGSAVVPLGAQPRTYRCACRYRIDVTYAPLPVLSRTQHGSRVKRVRHSSGHGDASGPSASPLFFSMFVANRRHRASLQNVPSIQHAVSGTHPMLTDTASDATNNVFVVFSVVGLNASLVCPHMTGTGHAARWKAHARLLWDGARRRLHRSGSSAMPLLPPAVVAIRVAISEKVFNACPDAFRRAVDSSSNEWDPTVAVDTVTLDEDGAGNTSAPPPAIVIHAQGPQVMQMRFQRMIDYYAFHGDSFFALVPPRPFYGDDARHHRHGDDADGDGVAFAAPQVAALLDPPAAAAVDAMHRNVWLAAVLRGAGVLTHEPTFPVSTQTDGGAGGALERTLSHMGVALPLAHALLVLARVRAVFVGSIQKAFVAVPAPDVSHRHFTQVLMAIVANDACSAGDTWAVPFHHPTRGSNEACALLLA